MTVSFFGRYKTRLHLCDYPRVESKFQSAAVVVISVFRRLMCVIRVVDEFAIFTFLKLLFLQIL
jgi:hypothetical protein